MAKRPDCTNEDGHAPRPAVVRTTWPSGRFNPGYACRSCLRMLITLYVTGPDAIRYGGPYALTIEPLP